MKSTAHSSAKTSGEASSLEVLREENAHLRELSVTLRQEASNSQTRVESLKRELALIQELSLAIVSELNLNRVLELVAEKGRELINAESLLVPLIDKDKASYTYAATSGKNAEDIIGANFPIRVGMCGWVLTHNKPLLFGEPKDWLMDEKTTWEEGQPSALLVPLLNKGAIIGGLSGMGKVDGGSFSRRDLELLTVFANQVSIAIENASLFDEIGHLVDSLEERVEARTLDLITTNLELEAFSYSVSHDLRAPLRSIDGFSQALLEDYGASLDATASNYLKRICSNAQHMSQLIDALLKLSRLSRDEIVTEQINLSSLAEEIAARLQETEPERQVDFVIQPGLTAFADEKMMRVALENLLSNAWKYSSKQEHARIEFGVTENPDFGTCYFIRDNGAGFDMHLADKLFRPFKRLHANHDFTGDGIGLASVQRVIQRHGGKIWAEAKVNEGACFSFTLSKKKNERT